MTQELIERLVRTFEDLGFIKTGRANRFHPVEWMKREKSKTITKTSKSFFGDGDFTTSYEEGYTLCISEVSRRNATDENVSVDIQIHISANSCSRYIYKERVNVKMGDKALNKRIENIMNKWNELEY